MAASMSRDVVTWMQSEILCVESHSPPGRCSTKPRSVCTGPPRNTGRSPMSACCGSSFICASTSPSFMSRGLLSTMPRAPLSLCSHTRVTLCVKLPSASEGMATSRLLARELLSGMFRVWGCRSPLSRPIGDICAGRHRALGERAVDEFPLVGKAQRGVITRQGAWKGLEGAGEPENHQRRLVDLGIAAAALHRGLEQAPVPPQRDLDHRAPAQPAAPGGRGKVKGADTLDLAPPGVQIGRQVR